MKTHAAIMFVLIGILVFATNAKAEASGYTISKIEAQQDVSDAAEFKYQQFDVTVVAAACSPQFVNKPESYWRKYTWHSWKCGWIGFDGDGDDVWGGMRITGHSNGTYGYLLLPHGGIHWGTP